MRYVVPMLLLSASAFAQQQAAVYKPTSQVLLEQSLACEQIATNQYQSLSAQNAELTKQAAAKDAQITSLTKQIEAKDAQNAELTKQAEDLKSH